MNPAEHLRDILVEPSPDLFFSRNDSEDQRMGDIVIRKLEGYVPEVTVGIIGCPQDEGVRRNKGRVGAAAAPTEIRRALYKLTPFSPEHGDASDISTLRIFDFGDIRQAYTLEETHEQLSYAVETLLATGITPIVLGGGHDISYPNFVGMTQTISRVGVVNVDAHLDYRKPVPERNSGTSFRQMLEDDSSKLRPENFVEFGVQPFANSSTHFRELAGGGVHILPLGAIDPHGRKSLFARALETASQSTERIMVSFDMDAVRSSDAPGVSAPSPLGFHAEDMITFALMAGRNPTTRLIDIVEVNPTYDLDGRTSKLAALVLMNFLSGFLSR